MPNSPVEPRSPDFSPLAKNPSGFRAAKTSGIWRIIPSPQLTELIAQAGFDFQILDCEHGAYDYATLLADILACEVQHCAPLVRVSGTSKVEVQRCLDLGAHGIVFPQLATRDDFARAAAMMDYAPAGTRGFNPFVRSGHYGSGTSAHALRPARPWFVPIVETLSAVAELDAILRLERIDLIYIGSYDLSAQLGCPGQMTAPALSATVDTIIAKCQGAGKAVAMMTLSPETTRALTARGVQALVHGVESSCFRQAAAAVLPTANGSP
jgi:4-hydroxy-2-oxoheptanedioate aldolase